jgi:hypothetical protein
MMKAMGHGSPRMLIRYQHPEYVDVARDAINRRNGKNGPGQVLVKRSSGEGKRGGQQSRLAADASNEPIDVPETAADAKRVLGEAIALTRAGRMNPKIGTALSYMTMAFLPELSAELGGYTGVRHSPSGF